MRLSAHEALQLGPCGATDRPPRDLVRGPVPRARHADPTDLAPPGLGLLALVLVAFLSAHVGLVAFRRPANQLRPRQERMRCTKHLIYGIPSRIDGFDTRVYLAPQMQTIHAWPSRAGNPGHPEMLLPLPFLA